MSARAVPFYCPYCGEEDLVPEPAPGGTGEGHGHWACRACRRAFRLSLTALATASAPTGATEPRSTTSATPASTTRAAAGAAHTTATRTGSANGTAVAPSDVEERN